tara:strand:- start:13145 stop:14272 length:1128 start_codon:yes stop_codon:yes gene_type:complete
MTQVSSFEKKINKFFNKKDLNQIINYFLNKKKKNLNELIFLIRKVLENKINKNLKKNIILKKNINFEIKKLKYGYLNYKEWMVLSNILLMCGLVIESYKIKLISFKAYENKNQIFFNLKKYLFYKIIISKKKNFFKSNFFFILIKIFFKFYFFLKFYNKDFSKLIKNKTINIIGPSEFKNTKKNKIKKGDLVVRFSYFGQQLDKNYFNKLKPNISYLNGQSIDEINLDKSLIKRIKKIKIDFLCLKKKSVNKFITNQRVYFNTNFFFSGSPNMLQHCLVDLLFHGAKNIKLNNINFYLDKNPYHKNYAILKNIKHNSLKEYWLYGFAIHDWYCNFLFIKYLYYKKLISVSDEIKKILKLDDLKIYKLIEKYYSFF